MRHRADKIVMKKLLFLFLFLGLTTNLYAQEVLAGENYKEETVTLNEELRELRNIASSDKSLTTGVSGILPIANGGTSKATAQTALDALLPAQGSASGKALMSNGTNGTWTTPSYFSSGVYVSSFGRGNDASGDESYTGTGFQPKGIIFFLATTTVQKSQGFDDGTRHNCNYAGDSGTLGTTTSYSIYLFNEGTPGVQEGIIKTFDSNGFTITWTKVNAGSSGTIYYMAFK